MLKELLENLGNNINDEITLFIDNKTYEQEICISNQKIEYSTKEEYKLKLGVLSYVLLIRKYSNNEESKFINTMDFEIRNYLDKKELPNIVGIARNLKLKKLNEDDIIKIDNVVTMYEIEYGLKINEENRYEYIETDKNPNIILETLIKTNEDYSNNKELKKI